MFLHMLSEKDRSRFLDLAYLFCISDAPMLWDGKIEAELTGESDLSEVSLQISDAKSAVLANFSRDCNAISSDTGTSRRAVAKMPTGFHRSVSFDQTGRNRIENDILDRIKPLPLSQQNDPVKRQQIAITVLHELAQEDEESISVTKIYLYELLLLCQVGDGISSIEDALIKEFARLRQLDELIVGDLAEHAECVNREVVKALSVILE